MDCVSMKGKTPGFETRFYRPKGEKWDPTGANAATALWADSGGMSPMSQGVRQAFGDGGRLWRIEDGIVPE